MVEEKQIRCVLLYSILELDGVASKKVVLDNIEQKEYWIFSEDEKSTLQSRQESKWRNKFAFTRQHLVTEGYLVSAETNQWRITDSGRVYLEELEKEVAEINYSDINKISRDLYLIIQEKLGLAEREEDQRLKNSVNENESDGVQNNFNYNNHPQPKGEVSRTVGGTRIYKRDKKVSNQALAKANYKCEINCTHATFIRRTSNNYYTEPHHLIPMSETDNFDVSLDREQNIISLCSNCHNQIHYGKKQDARKMIELLYNQRSELLTYILGREISLEDLLLIYGINND